MRSLTLLSLMLAFTVIPGFISKADANWPKIVAEKTKK
jgi:hypothetical protein